MSEERYTVKTYDVGYKVTDDGDIVRPDGMSFEPGEAVTISKQHLDLARERKREPKTIRVNCRSPRHPKD